MRQLSDIIATTTLEGLQLLETLNGISTIPEWRSCDYCLKERWLLTISKRNILKWQLIIKN